MTEHRLHRLFPALASPAFGGIRRLSTAQNAQRPTVGWGGRVDAMRVKLVKDRKSGAQTLTAGIARGESLDVRAAQWLAQGHWYMMPFRYEEADRETLLYYDVTGTGTLHDTLRRPIGGVQYTYLLMGVLFVMEQCEAQGLSLACVQWDPRRIHVAPQGYPLFMVVPARGIDPGRDNVVTLLTLLANDRKVRFPTEQEQAYQAQLAGFLAQVGQAGAVGFSSASFHDFLAWLMPGSVPPRTAGGAAGEGTGVGADGAAAAGAAAFPSGDGATVTVAADAGAVDRFGTTVVTESVSADATVSGDTQFGATVAVGVSDETVAGAGHFDTTVAVQGAARGVRAQSRQNAASSGSAADADATIASVGAHMSMESPETGVHAGGADASAGGQADGSAGAGVEDDDDIDGTVLSKMNTRRDEYLYGEAGAALRRQRMSGADETTVDGSAARTDAGAAAGAAVAAVGVDEASSPSASVDAIADADAIASSHAGTPVTANAGNVSAPITAAATAPQSGADDEAGEDIADETVLSARIRDLHPKKPSRSHDAPPQDARPRDVRADANRGGSQPEAASSGNPGKSAQTTWSTRASQATQPTQGSGVASGNSPVGTARSSQSQMGAPDATRPTMSSRRPAHAVPDTGVAPHASAMPNASANAMPHAIAAPDMGVEPRAGVAQNADATSHVHATPDDRMASNAAPHVNAARHANASSYAANAAPHMSAVPDSRSAPYSGAAPNAGAVPATYVTPRAGAAPVAGMAPVAGATPYANNAAVDAGAQARATFVAAAGAAAGAGAPVAGDSDEGSEDETMLRPSARQKDGFVVRRLRDGREVVCHARQATIGRSKTADIHMGGNTNVSRIHATITMLDDGRFAITDHDSANGTSVGGRALASGGTEYLRSGGDFALADDTFIVRRL